MTDIVAFVRARLDEDEQTAQDCEFHNWGCSGREVIAFHEPAATPVADGRYRIPGAGPTGGSDPLDERDTEHIARHDPARVLAEVAAKRRILDAHGSLEVRGIWCCVICSGEMPVMEGDWPCLTVALLALPFASHPDYDPNWSPV